MVRWQSDTEIGGEVRDWGENEECPQQQEDNPPSRRLGMPNHKDEDVQLITYLPRDLRREFKHLATAQDASMSKIVREAIGKMVREAQTAAERPAPSA